MVFLIFPVVHTENKLQCNLVLPRDKMVYVLSKQFYDVPDGENSWNKKLYHISYIQMNVPL